MPPKRTGSRGRGDWDWTLAERRAVLWLWKEGGHAKLVLAKRYGIHPGTISLWWKKYRENLYGPKDLHLDSAFRKSAETRLGERLGFLTEKADIERSEAPPTLLKTHAGISLFDFTRDILGYDLMTKNTHGELCERFEHAFLIQQDFRKKKRSKQQALLNLLPRGSFKTTVGSIGAPLWALAELDPNLRILLDSETRDLSKQIMQEIRGHLESNGKFIERYGDWTPEVLNSVQRWSNFEMDVKPRTKHRKEATFSCSGVDVAKTGFHYDYIVEDDLQSERNTRTIQQIDKVIEHYRMSTSLLEPDSVLAVNGTRYTDGDLYGHILENEQGLWDVMLRSAIDEEGNLFFPERLTAEFLETQRRRQDTYIFACQYLNNPIGAGTSMFQKSWIKYYDKEDLPDWEDLNLLITIDPASNGKEARDSTAMALCAHDALGGMWVIDGFCENRVGASHVVDETIRVAEKYRDHGLNVIGVENHGFQDSLCEEFKRRMKQRKSWFTIRPLSHSGKRKASRIAKLEPIGRNGLFHVPRSLKRTHMATGKEYDFVRLLEDQWTRYPRTPHEDILDALQYQVANAVYPSSSRRLSQARLRNRDPRYARIERIKNQSAVGAGGSEAWYYGRFD